MDSHFLLLVISSIVGVNFVLEQVLNLLNRRQQKHALPEELREV